LGFRKQSEELIVSLVYNEEQQQLDDSAREFLAARSPVAEQRRLRDDKVAEGFDSAIWQQMLELGWGGIDLPEADGGLEFGFQGFAPVFNHLGRNLAASPLLSSVVLCAELINQLGSEEQRNAWLPGLIEGQQRLALASHNNDRFRPEKLAVNASANGSDYVLDGADLWVPDGNLAATFLVAARLNSGEAAVFLVPADSAGVRSEALQLLDSRNHARVSLKQVAVLANARLGEQDASDALLRAFDRGAVCQAAELLGSSEVMFRMTIDYMKTRTQFNAPIGSFQALQHRAAWMHVELELARSAVLAGFEVLANESANAEERQQLVSLAKWKAGEAAHKISREAVQLHGGIGVTDEYDLGLFVKRSRVAQALFGDSDYHCERYGQMAQQQSHADKH